MKPVIWIRLLLFSLVIGQFRGMEARTVCPGSHAKTDSLLNPVLMKGAERILHFDKTALNVGTLTEDDAPQTYSFTCTNVSDKVINITRVRTTCGCAKSDVHTGELLPRETRVIKLVFFPDNHPGTIDTSAFVYLSSSDKAPVARLTLRGNVLPGADKWRRYPYSMGKLRLKQNRMEFGEVTPGKRSSERILCGNSGNEALRLSASGLPGFATFRTEPEVIAPDGEADIVITIDAALIPAERGSSFTFFIMLEGVDGQPSERTLNIKVNRIK
ncbi:DUF1573 domain-containing protein [Bacteroides ovatus]|uniref:DUF1573 domain-containing protein n=1 Tax=Bacteroides ovatus TaxID=28116 RepID=UPI00202DC672|nr:DUF1573 domain-containing protein [Bacteroides ovatus]MCM1718856.1 DUF1573 domain-containing protein [Bacteroides ovatus]MCM1757393.1 DUF1573 domain-containing protein [Bacteroides ovatus]MCM1864817.1 DUF1573 domain-containing protein [Bacteroides ovatus]MCM1910201.1 DUF1573 domain-containing protein [Bacteroides ovatus]MDC2382488.1 DUF1573 domain-containing protein [Bacteroides ovatus]